MKPLAGGMLDNATIAFKYLLQFPDVVMVAGIERIHEIDEIIQGTVTNVVNFGAFVRIEEGIEGLIHNSAWSDSPPHPSVQEGDIVHVRVVSLDRIRHRMGLSLERIVESHSTTVVQ